MCRMCCTLVYPQGSSGFIKVETYRAALPSSVIGSQIERVRTWPGCRDHLRLFPGVPTWMTLIRRKERGRITYISLLQISSMYSESRAKSVCNTTGQSLPFQGTVPSLLPLDEDDRGLLKSTTIGMLRPEHVAPFHLSLNPPLHLE